MRLSNFALLIGVCLATTQARSQTVTVFAAASLKESATEIAVDFEASHPGVKVSLNFGGSQQLAAQIKQGAPADVLLSAGLGPLNPLDIDRASIRIFASNRLALVVPQGTGKVRRFDELNQSLQIVIADSRVPVGHYTDLMLVKVQAKYGRDWVAKFRNNVVSKEQDVRAVLTKISLGEADAGIVYTTDVLSAKGKVRTIPIPPTFNVEAEYPAVRLQNGPNPRLGAEFFRFMFERQARQVLSKFGFGLPNAAIRRRL